MKILGCWKFSHRYQIDGDFSEGGEMLMILYWCLAGEDVDY